MDTTWVCTNANDMMDQGSSYQKTGFRSTQVHRWDSQLGQKEIMKYTTVKISEIRKHPTMRLDAKYWIKKKKKAASRKLQATSSLTCEMGHCRI